MLEFYHNLNINSGLPPPAQAVESNLKDSSSSSSSNGGSGSMHVDGSEKTDIVGTIKSEKTQELCEGCGQKIKDRYFMKLSPDQFWHEQCLLCCICRIQLSQTCYTKNTKVYCKDDYYRIYGVSSIHQQNQQNQQPGQPQQQQQQQQLQQHQRDCYGCGERIAPSEMVMRAKHLVYHLHCFLCYTCNRPLQKGEPFSLRAGKLICQHDLEKDFYGSAAAVAAAAAMHHHHHHGGGGPPGIHPPHHPAAAHLYGADADDYLLEDGLRTRDGRRGPKRPRTILTSAQRRQFKASFDVSPKPCRKVREALAKDTGLSVRVVQVWFQNQRAKMKKISRKSKANANGDSEKNHSDKEDKSIKLESPGSDHSHYLGLDSSYSSSSQPLNPNLPYSPDFPDNSDASLCSSDISLDESFDNVDEATSDTMSLQNLDLHPGLVGGGGGHGTIGGPGGTLAGLHNGQGHHQQQQQQQQLVNHNNNTIGSMMPTVAGSITHIDKLYLMQNSYFNSTQIEQ